MRLALRKVKTYPELQKTVDKIKFPAIECEPSKLTIDCLLVDELSVPLVPPEISATPVEIYADGNCLPRVASLFAYHTENNHEELRYRILSELVTNEEYYLSKELDHCDNRNSAANFAMFSESFTGQKLTKKTIQEIFRQELLTIIPNGSYMGAWQVAAIATVLNRSVKSVYPVYAAETVRKDLNRVFEPFGQDGVGEPLHILWTNTQGVDLKPRDWRPNHFVLLIPE